MSDDHVQLGKYIRAYDVADVGQNPRTAWLSENEFFKRINKLTKSFDVYLQCGKIIAAVRGAACL